MSFILLPTSLPLSLVRMLGISICECHKLSLQHVHIPLEVKDVNLVMEVRYNHQGIIQMDMGSDKKPTINLTILYIHQSSISYFYYSIL